MKRENIYQKLNTPAGIAALLALEDFAPVYREADRIRREAVGDVVHLRAIIEFSNICRRQCRYCGLNCRNKALPRYRMSAEEILETAAEAVAAGYRTIVLQSGEDEYFTAERLGAIIAAIKALRLPEGGGLGGSGDACSGAGNVCSTVSGAGAGSVTDAVFGGAEDLQRHPAVTISCGERPPEDYRYWREKGVDRYLLKHETADPEIYADLHPCGTLAQRIDCLKTLEKLGYETGSGFMVGLPGQTLETIGRDLLLLKEIPCSMAGIGPFIANPKTPLAGARNGEPELVRRSVATARLLLPKANLPLTTALSVLSQKEKPYGGAPETPDDARRTGTSELSARHPENPFNFGANVIMKKVTPDKYKSAYEIYPADFQATDIKKDRKQLEQIIRDYNRVPL